MIGRLMRWGTAERWGARLAVLLAGLIAPRAVVGQGADSLSLEAFLSRVRDTHPLAQQAMEQRRQVAQELRVARGGFDPSISATWDLKRFNGIGYFDELDARLTVPTPWGLDFTMGWERAAGQIINPERKTPGQGLLSAGVSLPIGPRLLTDERRTALRQAELADEGADADRDLAVARLLQGAARDWGSWWEGEARLGIAEEGVALAAFRLDAVRKRVIAGAGAAIDSVEALAEWERRRVLAIEARAAREAARLVVTGYLWGAQGEPVALPATSAPAGMRLVVSRLTLTGAIDRHPAVQQVQVRWLQADAQRRLALVSVVPSANLEVAGLGAGREFGALDLSGEDYKAGVSTRLPLLARREFGRLRSAEARTTQLRWERDRVRRDVALAVDRATVELRGVEGQLAGQRRVIVATEALLVAEQRRFETGASSLLIVNLRERAVLDERLRLAQLEGRRAAALGALVVALGDPSLLIGDNGR